ncbi:MAG: hypothetical protein KKB51_22435 [Candidatus Riflebacteria bacterium]|nr:hypothetical protein [Candidatus Riflebacteria bacterium]
MTKTVKGIQYSYQIDFFNQVPTHVKSQVHRLPVLPAPQASPVDQINSRDTYLPLADQAVSFAGTRAAAPDPATTPLAPQSATPPTTPLPSFTNPDARAGNSPRYDSAVAEPAQIARRMSAENANLRPASSLAAETLRDNPIMPAELPNPLAGVLPTAEATPSAEVKAIPRYEYDLALRAYKPDASSFLQPGGYEKSDFGRADFFAQPASTVLKSPALPTGSSQIEINPYSENEAKIQSAIAARQPAESSGEVLQRKEREQPLTAKSEKPEQTMRMPGESFLARQAIKLYEIFATPTMVNTGNLVNLRF